MNKISRFGYLIDYNQENLSKVSKDLKIVPYVNSKYNSYSKPIQLYKRTKNCLIVPKYYGIDNFGDSPRLLKTNIVDSSFFEFNGNLREHQKPIVQKTMDTLKTTEGGILAVYCGFGKTSVSLYIISQLKVKTLIIVHTTVLLNQWIERIEQFLPNARIGIIQRDKVEVENKDIVIAMIHSISMKDYDRKVFESFDFCIVDEVHLTCTRVFTQAYWKIGTKYSLGLSATPYREDKCESIFHHFLGPIIHYEKRKPDSNIQVNIFRYHGNFETKFDKNNEPSYVNTLLGICNDPLRRKFITSQLVKISKENRKILVLSDYVEPLESLHHALNEHGVESGLYIGKIKKAERMENSKKQIILGTYKIASVGFDVEDLNTIMMISPRKDPEQSVGRILRRYDMDKLPEIYDIRDVHFLFQNTANKRDIFYKKNGYTFNRYKVTIENDCFIIKKEEPPKKRAKRVTDDLSFL